MDKISEFVARYEANFGYFPTQKGGKGEKVMAHWRQWLIPITPEKIEKTFKVLESHRAHMGKNFRPTLEEFKRAHAEVEGRGNTMSTAQMKAKEEMGRPLFDFGKEGYPRVREALFPELPKKTAKRFKECWAQLMDRGITPKEFREIQDRERWYLPEWGDYTSEERDAMCARWKIENPDSQIPF